MKIFRITTPIFLTVICCISGCRSLIGVQTATALGSTGGEAVGGVFGKASGNAAAGAVIGETLGQVTGSVVGISMDKQAADIKKDVSLSKVDRVGDGIVVEFNSKILFESNHAELSNAAEKSLNDLVNVFKKYPDTHLEILGHTDNKGTTSLNQTLSEKRASAVANYLNSKGIDNSRITYKGIGSTKPKYDNGSKIGRLQNRRVEVVISK